MRTPHAGIALIAAALACASCGGQSESRDQRGVAYQGIDGRITVIRPGDDSNKAFTEGMDLKTKGDCAGAIQKLRPVANIGVGYESAQTALGDCLLRTGVTGGETSADYLDGLTWLRRAADAGWPEAQGHLAIAYAKGPGSVRNGEEAAYWLALYRSNPSKSRIGFTPLPAADIASVQNSLSPTENAAGEKRAATWQRKIWVPPAPQVDDLKKERGPRVRERRMQPLASN